MNNTKLLFQTAFNSITIDGKKIYEHKYETICDLTFRNKTLIAILSDIITTDEFIHDVLVSNIGRLDTQVLLNNTYKMKELLDDGYMASSKTIKLAIINDNLPILKLLTKDFNGSHLYDSCLLSSRNVYFYLRGLGIQPNASMLNVASASHSLEIIQDITEYVGVSTDNVKLAAEFNQDTAKYLLSHIDHTPKLIFELANFAITNGNLSMVQYYTSLCPIKQDVVLFYNALTSGNMSLIRYIRELMPDIEPDCSKTGRGQNSLLTKDMIYVVNGEKYFSHTMNYAVQSKSLEVVKYVHSLGYGITANNFVTAIKQGTVEIISYLSDHYDQKLPYYIMYYLGYESYTDNKLAKATILLDKVGEINRKTINDYKLESIHSNLVAETKLILSEIINDSDFLIPPSFSHDNPYTKLIGIYCNLYLRTNHESLIRMYSFNYDQNTIKHMMDVLFSVGTIQQVTHIFPLIRVPPSIKIMIELITTNSIGKICYLHKRNLVDVNVLYNVAISLNHQQFIKLFAAGKPNIKSVIMSGNRELILQHVPKDVDVHTLKSIIKLDRIDILSMFNIVNRDELIEWSKANGYIYAANYISSS